MGRYTDNLYRGRRGAQASPRARSGERLTSAAIRRQGEVYSMERSHWQIRAALGDEDPSFSNPSDEEGFLTSTGRFVTRAEAKVVGEAAGQCSPMQRQLLSSDVRW